MGRQVYRPAVSTLAGMLLLHLRSSCSPFDAFHRRPSVLCTPLLPVHFLNASKLQTSGCPLLWRHQFSKNLRTVCEDHCLDHVLLVAKFSHKEFRYFFIWAECHHILQKTKPRLAGHLIYWLLPSVALVSAITFPAAHGGHGLPLARIAEAQLLATTGDTVLTLFQTFDRSSHTFAHASRSAAAASA